MLFPIPYRQALVIILLADALALNIIVTFKMQKYIISMIFNHIPKHYDAMILISVIHSGWDAKEPIW